MKSIEKEGVEGLNFHLEEKTSREGLNFDTFRYKRRKKLNILRKVLVRKADFEQEKAVREPKKDGKRKIYEKHNFFIVFRAGSIHFLCKFNHVLITNQLSFPPP